MDVLDNFHAILFLDRRKMRCLRFLWIAMVWESIVVLFTKHQVPPRPLLLLSCIHVDASPVPAFFDVTRRSSFFRSDPSRTFHRSIIVPCRHILHSNTSRQSSSWSELSTSTTEAPSNTTKNNNNTFFTRSNKHDQDVPSKKELPQLLGLSPSDSLSPLIRNGISELLALSGFIKSSIGAIVGDPLQVWNQSQGPLKAFQTFLQTSGIDKELDKVLKQSALSMALLFRVQSRIMGEPIVVENQDGTESLDTNFWNPVKRYMRYATAVYGQSMIWAATVNARERVLGTSKRDLEQSLKEISKYINVPVKDLVWAEVDFDYSSDQYLRHLVAIDHKHREVVLAIRGTFTLQEVLVDITAFSREDFCGGEAHEGMATMAERLWQVAGPTIVKTLQEHPDYQLVVTGHSLGAGTATLLTILLKQQQRSQQLHRKLPMGPSQMDYPMIPPSTPLRCVAFASPPVFTPLEFIPDATKVITHFIHERDVVPFLSVYSVRHLLANLEAIQSINLPLMEKLAIVTGSQPPPPEMVTTVRAVTSVPPVKGAPLFQVPAAQTVWLRSSQPDQYKFHVWKHLPFAIRVHPNMLVDHLPPRYEYALDHLNED